MIGRNLCIITGNNPLLEIIQILLGNNPFSLKDVYLNLYFLKIYTIQKMQFLGTLKLQ